MEIFYVCHYFYFQKKGKIYKKIYISQNLEDIIILHTTKKDKNAVNYNCKMLLIARSIPISQVLKCISLESMKYSSFSHGRNIFNYTLC